MNEIGANTATSTAVVAMTAKAIRRAPRKPASSGGSPASSRRWMFSSTTMASSTTRPTASTSASRVRMLIEKPSAASAMNDAITDTGIATAGMIVARTDRRKT